MFGGFREDKSFDVLEKLFADVEEYVDCMSGTARFSDDDYVSDIVKHYVLASNGNGLAKKVLDSFEGNGEGHFSRLYAETVKLECELRRVVDKYRVIS